MDDKIQLVKSEDSRRPSEPSDSALRRAAVIFLLFLLLLLSAFNSGCDLLHDADPPAKRGLVGVMTSGLWPSDHAGVAALLRVDRDRP